MKGQSPDERALLRHAGTFMGAPVWDSSSDASIGLLGIPFDCGLHPIRVGSRMGPSAIREQSGLVRPYQPPMWDSNLIEALGVVDCGDVEVMLGDVLTTFERIEAATTRLIEAGLAPVTFGGDGSVTLPQLRSVHRAYSDLVVLHFDAHTDTYPDSSGPVGEDANLKQYNPATTFSRAAEEGLIDTRGSLHIGARGTIGMQGVFEFTRSRGYELITGVDLSRMGVDAMLAHAHERLAGRPVYLCWDMDFFDPSCAPGVFTPTWGGVSAREGLGILQGLAGLDIVATDINTLSPLHDIGGMSAFLAATCVLECIHLVGVALARRGGANIGLQ